MLSSLASVFLFVCTGYYIVLVLPFLFYYLLQIFYNWKIAYMLLLFCIPASVQIDLLRHTLAVSLPDEPMAWLFLTLFIILLATKQHLIPKWWWNNPITLIIILQFLWLIVAVMFSEVWLFSLKFLIAKAWYIVCFFVFPVWIFKKKKDIRQALIIVLLPMLATMLIIVCRHSLLQFKFRSVQDAIGLLYYNHVEYAAVISIFLPFLIVSYPLIKPEQKWLKKILLIAILFFITAIFFSYARAAIIAVLFSALVAVAIRCKKVNFIIPFFYSLVILLLVYLIGFNKYTVLRPRYDHTYIRSSFSEHVIATFRGQDMSSMERLYRWIAAVRMSMARPLTGFGPHSFYYFYKQYTLASFKTYVSVNTERSTTHNYFLLMLTEQGWPAMLLYAILIIVVFAQAQRTYHRSTDKFYKACTLGLAMAFAACFVNNLFSELLETHKVGALFYLILALLVILDHKSKETEQGVLPDTF